MAEPEPLISIVVPTRRRPGQLMSHLESMTRLSYSARRYEIIVVNDGGPEPLEAVAAAFHRSLPLTLLSQPRAGPGAARNAGATRARGQYLVFTADDCHPAADWLSALERRLVANPGTLVGGGVANGLPDDLYATTSSLLIDYLYGAHDRQATHSPFFTPNNMALPTELFHRVGGFDASMGAAGEDRDLCDRWLAHDLPMISAPEAVVQHFHPQSLRTFWRQHVAYGRGSRRFYRKRSQRGETLHPVHWTPEPLPFYLKLVWYPISRSPGYRGWLQAGMMVVSQVANLFGFVLEGFRPATKV